MLPKRRDILGVVLTPDENTAQSVNDENVGNELGGNEGLRQSLGTGCTQSHALARQRRKGNIVPVKVHPESETPDAPTQGARIHFLIDVEDASGVWDCEVPYPS